MALIAIAILLLGGVAYYLLRSDSNSRAQLRNEFDHRALLAANLTSATVMATVGDSSDAQKRYSGPAGRLTGMLRRAQEQSGDPLVAVYDGEGRVLDAWPRSGAAAAEAMARAPDVQRALSTGSALSDIFFYGGSAPMLRSSAAFETRYGRRVYVDVTSAKSILLASAYLSAAPAVPGAHAYLLDGGERILAASSPAPQGIPLPDAALGRALPTRSQGNVGASYFVTAPIRAHTNWRLAFSVPQSALYAQLRASRTSNWLLFVAFTAAVLALLAAAASTFRKSAQLAAAREREDTAQRLAHERLHDGLTGLPNRALFLDRAEHALARIARSGWSLGVLFIDLDHFKRINDSLGHACGDELLNVVAKRLRGAIRPADTVSRFGGDEFLILCEDLFDGEDALLVAGRIRAVLEEPVTISGRELRVTCCIGVALQRADAPLVDGGTLVRDADAAMYAAKASGRGRVKVFDDELHREAMRRLDTEVALRAAVENEELEVHYQPIVELPSGRTCGVEALARWHRPGVGLVPPLDFIPLAEECGVIDLLGHLVLSRAMAELQRWHEADLVDDRFALSVNVSPRQLINPGFPASVRRLLDAWSLPPGALCLEITESAVVNDTEASERALLELNAIGVQLAIDDFGIGQSSLEQLIHSLPVDILKLDRVFVSDMEGTREGAVVAAVAPMAGDLGMAAIAEGVETADQAEKLAAMGYPLAQGYFFGRPADAESVRVRLAGAASTAA